ncbi:MAG: DUF2730 family protein [Sphingobium limneticum]
MSSGPGIMPFIALLLGIANIFWSWHTRSQSASEARVKRLEERLDLVEDRQITVEEQLKHLPTKDDLHRVTVQLADVHGLIGRQGSEIASVARVVDRIDTYLREKA